MTNSRISKEYKDGCRSFVDFAIRCKTPDRLIFCPCKTCRLNRQHPPRVVYDHLIGRKGMWSQYKNWIYHGERPIRAPVEGFNLTKLITNAGVSTYEGGNMHAILRDLFGIHDVKEDNYEPQPKV
jgi:hypothetical protein